MKQQGAEGMRLHRTLIEGKNVRRMTNAHVLFALIKQARRPTLQHLQPGNDPKVGSLL